MSAPHQSLARDDQVAALEQEVSELRALRLLVGGLAHDFNNLLTAIAGHAALLEAEHAPGGEVHESASAILKAAEHASAIAAKLQDIARRGKLRREPVDLHEVVTEVVTLLRPTTDRRIAVRYRFRAPSARLIGDPELIHQLVLNLTLNAREAMPDGGELVFETGLTHGAPGRGGVLVLSVRDTGRGISAEDRERIFDPFFTTRGSGQGTGLGLTVVAGIVKKHQGRIEVESVEGRGSTFQVCLPAPKAASLPS